MSFVNYIWPSEISLQIIILLIWLVAMLVAYFCNRLISRIKNNMKLLDENFEGNLLDVVYLEQMQKKNNVDYETQFHVFINSKVSVEGTEPVKDHLKAIYNAGLKSSRLDADMLVKNTVSNILQGSETIKTCISLFLVCGILGTLIGLAISIGSFSGEGLNLASATAAGSDATKQLNAQINELFKNLRGAFAPSMWGVAATICFVFYYTFILQEKYINRLTERLTIVTINSWLPHLYPTDFQKGENSMVRLKETINNADKINEDANALLYNLSQANETVAALKDVSQVLNDSSQVYKSSSEEVKALGTNISNMRDVLVGIISNTKISQEAASKRFEEYAGTLEKNFGQQNDQIRQIIATLKLYEDKYVQNQEEIRDQLSKNIVENKKAVASLQDVEGEIQQAVTEPLQRDLGKLVDTLKEVKQEMHAMRNPLDQAADSIYKTMNGSLDKFDQILAARSGLSPEQIEKLVAGSRNSISPSVKVDNSRMEEMLSTISGHLADVKKNLKSLDYDKASEPFGLFSKYMPFILGLLLFVSIMVQGVMVMKLGDLQETQAENIKIMNQLEKNQSKLTEILNNQILPKDQSANNK